MIDAKQLAAKPEDLGIDSEKLEAVFARARRDVDDGTLPSAQVAIARRGKLAGMRTYGSAVQGGVEKPASDDTLYHFFSSTKAVVSAAVWLLFEEGQLRLDEKVAEIIPEFGTNAKEAIDVETLMLHAGGFPLAPFAAEKWTDRAALLRAFSQWRLNWPVDGRYEYHATPMHWVLSEILERRGGLPWKEFIRERITGPMALDELYIGCPLDRQHRVADVCYMSPPVEPPGGWGEVTPEAILRFNEPAVRAAGVPGGGGVASAAAMALFYQPLVNGGETADGTRIMKRETIAFGTKVRAKPHHIDLMLKLIDPSLNVNTNRASALSLREATAMPCTVASAAPARRARSGTAAPAVRSRGAIPRRASASATRRTASSIRSPWAAASPRSAAWRQTAPADPARAGQLHRDHVVRAPLLAHDLVDLVVERDDVELAVLVLRE